MEVKDYLIVYGHDSIRGGAYYKESIIDCNDLIKFNDIIKTIIDNQDKQCNWAWGIDLVKNNDPNIPYAYFDRDRLLEMYPNLSPSLLREFSHYLPSGITKIESIKVFCGEKIKII